MITYGMMDAIDMMIEMCDNEEQAKGMKSVREMLADFDEDVWSCMGNYSSCCEWVEQYLPRKKEKNKIVTISELANILANKELNEAVDFTFDDVLDGDEPSGWFGVKFVDLFDESEGCLVMGYYGGGATIVRNLDSDTNLEELLKEMLCEVSESDKPVEVVCIEC